MTAALVIPATLALPVAGSVALSSEPVEAEVVTIPLDEVSDEALKATPSATTPVPVVGEDHAHTPGSTDDHATEDRAVEGEAESSSAGDESSDLTPAAAIPPTSTEEFGLVGVTAAEPFEAGSRVVMRVREGDEWSSWMEVPISGHLPDPDTDEGRNVRYATEPVVVDDADGIQVRVDTPSGEVPEDAEVTMLSNPERPEDAALGATVGPASSAQAAVKRPTIISRAEWGASPLNPVSNPTVSKSLKVAFVHHVVSTNNYTEAQAAVQMRNVYGWFRSIGVNDFGYNFMVDRFGRIFEGRAGGVDKAIVGAHTSGFNAESFAVSFLGNADTLDPDSPQRERILNAMSDLIAWKFQTHGVDPLGSTVLTSAGPGPGQGTTSKYWPGEKVTTRTIAGHGDIGATSCPGVFLRPSLEHIRLGVSARMGRDYFPPSIGGDRVAWGSGGKITLTSQTRGSVSANLVITNACGAQVRTMSANSNSSGSLGFSWNLRDQSGNPVPPGDYTFRMSASSGGQQLAPWSGTARIEPSANSPVDPCGPPAQFAITGTGYGHGAGLSQWGAFAMANAGRSASNIVSHYYPGVSVSQHPDTADVRIALLQKATQAQARVENLSGSGSQLEVTVGSSVVRLGTGSQVTFTPSGSAIAVRSTTGGTSTNHGSAAKVVVRWSGTRAPGGSGTNPGLLNVIGPSETFASTGHRYRYGTVEITPITVSGAARLNVVNVLRLGDEYLKGIAEVNPTWPAAALEAQAIASRSYGLARLARGIDSQCNCHMDDGDGPKYDQTFRGWLAESQYGSVNKWARAVDATRASSGSTGLTALYKGTPIAAFYTAATGGHTLSADVVWGGSGFPWSVSVSDPWSRDAPGNPYRSWTAQITQARATQIFGISRITRLVPNRVRASSGADIGGVRSVTAYSVSGQTSTVSLGALRAAVGYTTLKSPYLVSISGQGTAISAPAPAPAPVPQGGVSLAANPSGDVREGTRVTLSGTISSPRAGQTVQRQVQTNGGAWQARNSVTPDSRGRFTLSVDIPASTAGTTYNWRVVVLQGGQPVASSGIVAARVVSAQVAPRPAPGATVKVTLKAKPAGNVRPGSKVKLTGKVSPMRSGLVVQRQVRVNGGPWTGRERVTPKSSGKFTLPVPIPLNASGTTYSWRVVVLSGGRQVGVSGTVKAKVTGARSVRGPVTSAKSTVSLKASASGAVRSGSQVRLSGTVKPMRSGLIVQRQVKVNGGAWQNRNAVRPDARGNFALSVPVSGPGTAYSWRVVVMSGSTPVVTSRARSVTVR